MKTAALIYNPVAGRHPARREREIQKVAAVLREESIAVRLMRTLGPGTACDLARAAVAGGTDLVVVCGGDGTINEVVNGVAPSETVLGILPGGTANIIAKELGLPHDPVRAAKQLSRWRPRRIALGRAVWACGNGQPVANQEQRFFLSVAGIGFDAYIVYKLSMAFKMSLGVVAYGWEAIRQALRYRFPAFLCQVDGHQRRATFAVVHRTKLYAGWFRLAPSVTSTSQSSPSVFSRARAVRATSCTLPPRRPVSTSGCGMSNLWTPGGSCAPVKGRQQSASSWTVS